MSHRGDTGLGSRSLFIATWPSSAFYLGRRLGFRTVSADACAQPRNQGVQYVCCCGASLKSARRPGGRLCGRRTGPHRGLNAERGARRHVAPDCCPTEYPPPLCPSPTTLGKLERFYTHNTAGGTDATGNSKYLSRCIRPSRTHSTIASPGLWTRCCG